MILYYITLACFIVFLISYIHDRRKIINGFLFNIFLFSGFLSIIYVTGTTRNNALFMFASIVSILLFFLMAFGVFIVIIVSFVNGIILMRREGRSLSNMLTLFLSIGLILLLVLSYYNLNHATPPYILSYILVCLYVVIFYLAFIFFNFIMSSMIYKIYRPRLNIDYIIVLGSGLLEGYRVSPLLARRIDRGLDIYHRQMKKKRKKKTPKIIMSGGQGADELLPEAKAMYTYALQKGIPESDLIIEDNSKNTMENMLFSKDIILSQMDGKKYKAIFSTSNYHVLRSGIDARKAGLKAQGVGSKTPFYFWYNAIIREYIAILVMYKKWHLFTIVILILLTCLCVYMLYNPIQFYEIIETIQKLL
ncbi:uncharacterized SAM-binding protein YcdF (DUF218 family) [Breznakia sp. PF5-3]|uniref:YdcF family protein n=1 Tax=unclassified Breznakia TaxID=2623764 RepID=UPI002405DD8F|nr:MULTISPECIES: YdcF family protein [unclassified Breznakia]MDF9824215.1 uncharacterized SAM-binding protein YcdF (DUF218 family) [Breznakia sp. PM6-1]MDF9835013.1 uncharacterized SAM-binding protein YcdF (DUF218 family) [Breznakia sp. PF5-3]MDF9837258.1 uncharacterized SAM-binding protein YcdF (DUF218 family) [Breznakia sp. PFB2-8]MDF9859248.1 uncharacterized SAM-binding protein YcdF (DUF218 family) [Breznakia sp. PH5-24]